MIDLDTTPSSLGDADLTRKLSSLIGEERRVLVDFLLHMAEFDARRLYAGLGYPSLFEYCRDGLKLSNASAFRRYSVARLVRRFPAIAEFLGDGRLSLTRVALLKDVLTDENHLELLVRASAGSERDVEVLVASLKPRPDVADSIRKVSVRPVTSAPEVRAAEAPHATSLPAIAPGALDVPTESRSVSPDLATSAPEVDSLAAPTSGPEEALRPPATSAPEVRARMDVEATSASAFSVRMRVGPEFIAEFEAVKAALSHKVPDGNFEAVLRECFRITLEACDRRRAATTRRCGTAANADALSQPTEPTSPGQVPATAKTRARAERSRYIPAPVRRAVWQRDEGRCAFVSADGKRCDSRHQLELHHREPFSTGGASTEANLSLRCRVHNHYEAELAFGPDFMNAKVPGRSSSPGRPALPPRKRADARAPSLPLGWRGESS